MFVVRTFAHTHALYTLPLATTGMFTLLPKGKLPTERGARRRTRRETPSGVWCYTTKEAIANSLEFLFPLAEELEFSVGRVSVFLPLAVAHLRLNTHLFAFRLMMRAGTDGIHFFPVTEHTRTRRQHTDAPKTGVSMRSRIIRNRKNKERTETNVEMRPRITPQQAARPTRTAMVDGFLLHSA